MHIRTEEGKCIGCIEVGLYEIVRMVITEEAKAAAREGEGTLAAAAATGIVTPGTRR